MMIHKHISIVQPTVY
jgi:signal recognition particle receptor subunit beta